jgi:hypothetical protein
MKRRIQNPAFILSTLLLALTGCAQQSYFSSSLWNPFGIIPEGEPVRIGISYDHGTLLIPTNWVKSAPWDAFARELSKELGRPVAFQNMKPFQIGFHLQPDGLLDFALTEADDLPDIQQEGQPGKILAVSEIRQRVGVIVANAKSQVQTVADLKGQRFAFGPKDDPVLHHAALAFLAEHGVAESDIQVLVPTVLQFHINSREAAKEIAYGPLTAGGVIEAEEFDAYPETGGSTILITESFSKDQFRELGRTKPITVDTMSAGPFLAGSRADPELVEKVRLFLLSAAKEHPQCLHAMGFARFNAPGEVQQVARQTEPTE